MSPPPARVRARRRIAIAVDGIMPGIAAPDRAGFHEIAR